MLLGRNISMMLSVQPPYPNAHVHCKCGNEFDVRSAKAELKVDVCAACHSFDSGKQQTAKSFRLFNRLDGKLR